jgi:eukaryotic-like serine/threonine-protein kinase
VTSIWPGERAQAALAFALCGDIARASTIADALASGSPEDTVLQSSSLPIVRAAVALAANRARDAVIELDRIGALTRMTIWPDLLRGQALLRLGDHKGAGEAFRSMTDNRGRYTWAYPLYPLSHLWLARAAARAGETAVARQEYEAFFTLWKNADADLRPLVDARRELTRLKARP